MPLPEKPERNAQIIGAYTNCTLQEIAKSYGLTRERVRQIIARHERKIGVLLPRHKASGRRAPRARWKCPGCGEEREELASTLAYQNKGVCWDCHTNRLNARTEEWIAARLSGESWTQIALYAGFPNPNHVHRIPLTIFLYLRRQNRLDELPKIWRGASTRWLSKRYPDVIIPGGSNEIGG